MAEDIEKKSFLDWGGLKTLWAKIISTFASKSELNEEIYKVNSDILELGNEVVQLGYDTNTKISGIEDLIETFMPREFENYTEAVAASSLLSPGTVIKILNDSQKYDVDGNPELDSNGEPILYRQGLYMIFNNKHGILVKISTTTGSGEDVTLDDLNNVVKELDAKLDNISENSITAGYVLDENGNVLYQVEKEGNSLIFKVDNEFVVNSESLHALTHKAAAIMYGNLINHISSIPKFKISIVDELPNFETDEISLSTIYLLKNNNETSNNMYAEYICIEAVDKNTNKRTLSWEKLGEQSLVIDDYATKEYVMQLLSETLQSFVSKNELEEFKTEVLTYIQSTYVTKEEIKDFINEDELSKTLENYYNKTEADEKFITYEIADEHFATKDDISEFLTEDEIIGSILYGNIGESIRITDEDINELN